MVRSWETTHIASRVRLQRNQYEWPKEFSFLFFAYVTFLKQFWVFYCSLQLSLKVPLPVKFSIICKIVIKICKILVLSLLYPKCYNLMSSLAFWWYLLLEQRKSGIEKTVSACIFPAWVVYSLYSIHTFHVLTRQPTWVLISSYTAPGRLCGHPSSTTWHEFNSHHGLTALLFALQKHHQVPGRAGTPGHRRGRRTPSSGKCN